MLLLLFLSALGEFVLVLLCKICHEGRAGYLLPECCMVVFLFALLCVANPAFPASKNVSVGLVGTVLLIVAVQIFITVVHYMKRRKCHLSPDAIKETTDNLPSGLCFADDSGRIILCNRRMGELSSVLIGSYPQMVSELEEALLFPGETSGVQRLKGTPALHRFPDGTVWRFRRTDLSEPKGFIQLMAQDVTSLHEVNERLRAENEEMQKVNEKLYRMYERLADRIREQEILDMKMRIHDNMGTSLIAISEIMNGSTGDEDMEKQLHILQDAVGYLSDDRPGVHGTFDEVRQKAAGMKVSLVLKGSIPENTLAESLIASAARECVTNCVNHAEGNCVTVEIREHMNIYTVTFTNNGEPPKQKIIEGGGLSTLRQSVEAAGGNMYLSHSPVFMLTLILPGKEREL